MALPTKVQKYLAVLAPIGQLTGHLSQKPILRSSGSNHIRKQKTCRD